MLKNSRNVSQKVLVGFIGLALSVSVASCSKSKNSAEPSISPSASVSTTAEATKSAKPTVKPTVKETAKPAPVASHNDPAPVKPTAKKPYTQTVAPKPPIKLDAKEQVFEKEFTRLTKLDPKAWDLKVDGDPLSYKIRYPELLKYAKGALCSYIATGLDDFTLGTYISNTVSYDMDIQNALLSATRKAYGCKG
jgi:hypothetical protein